MLDNGDPYAMWKRMFFWFMVSLGILTADFILHAWGM